MLTSFLYGHWPCFPKRSRTAIVRARSRTLRYDGEAVSQTRLSQNKLRMPLGWPEPCIVEFCQLCPHVNGDDATLHRLSLNGSGS